MEPINLQEYEDLAYERLEPTALDYYRSGSGDEVTLRANRAAFERIRLRPRVLVDVSELSLETTALGTPISMPIMVAPTAYQCLACEQGERDTARGAGAAGTLMVASTLATRTLEEIAEVATGPLWFQLYVYKERRVSEALVRRAEAAGYRALALTVDTPRLGQARARRAQRLRLAAHLHMANFADPSMSDVLPQMPGASGLETVALRLLDQSLTWDALAWLKSITSLPIVVKGILTAEDAQLAAEHGAAAIIVSNHGGRQLDGVLATIEALPEVVEAVAGRCEVYLDGGVRRGTDVLKALALGARGVFVGRPALWGLAVDGAAGVERMLTLLRDELELAMALAGRPTVASIDRSLVTLP